MFFVIFRKVFTGGLLICLRCFDTQHWAIPEKMKGGVGRGELRIWNCQWYQRNSMWNFQGLITNEVEFPRVTKKKECGVFSRLCLGGFRKSISSTSRAPSLAQTFLKKYIQPLYFNLPGDA